MQLNRLGASTALLLVATVALLATVLARPPSLASAHQVDAAVEDSISANGAFAADHANWSRSKKFSAPERITVGDDDTPRPNDQGDEPPEPGDAEEPPEPAEPDEPSEPDEPAEPEEPPEPGEPAEPEDPAEPAESEEPSESVGEPDTGTGILEQQITVSLFLAVVVVIGALLAVAYRRR